MKPKKSLIKGINTCTYTQITKRTKTFTETSASSVGRVCLCTMSSLKAAEVSLTLSLISVPV